MKQFAFPLSVKCANEQESDQCEELLKSLGYKNDALCGTREIMVTNYMKDCYEYASVSLTNIYNNDRHHIDHFNPALFRDIAAACTNDTWQEDEPLINLWHNKYQIAQGAVGSNYNLNITSHRRPTLAEICEHHGYEIKGRNIVKKVETVSNCDKSYCETARQLDEAKSEIKRLKYENDDLREKLEAMTDVDNHELARLRSKIDDLEDINAVITKELKCTQDKATGKIDELTNKLQHNDKLHVKELEMLTDIITELSRDKAELITKLNCLSAPAGIFHTSRPLEFHPINLPEFSEREKKRLLRLAERIERLIK